MKITQLSFLLPIALLLNSLGAQAQQAPDCSACPACNFSVPTGATTLATLAQHDLWFANEGDSYTWNNLFNNQFHRINFRNGYRYTISLCGNTQNTFLYVNNNGFLPQACNDNGCGDPGTPGPSLITYTHVLPSGLGRIYAFNGSCNNPFPIGTNLTMTITRIAPEPTPVNDEPCGAIALPMGVNCSFLNTNNTAATLSAITGTGLAPVCPNGEPSLLQNDVWFTTTVPPSGLIGISTEESGSLCAGGYAIYTATACNGTFTQLANSCSLNGPTSATSTPASAFDAFAAGLPAGATVYIRYWERNGNENGTFSICAYEAIRPENDNPCGAITLPVGLSCSLTTYSNANATNLSGPTASGPTCAAPANNDLWFAITVTPDMVANGITVNTAAGTQNDWAMAWYRLTSGTCGTGSFTQIACNDNQTAAILMPRINSVPGIPLVNGETIYIRVWNKAPWEGTFGICATLNQPPPNDNPCGAIPLTANYGCIIGNASNESGTPTTHPFSGGTFAAGTPNPTCAPTNWHDDVWYSVVMPPNGTIQIDTQVGTLVNGGAALYSATGTCGGGNLNLTQVACAINGSQQGPTSANMPYINYTNPALAGQTLYVRVWRMGPANPNGNFGICARRTDAPPTDCFYTLNLFDSAGDGWQGSFVTVCVAGVCTNYTLNGANASVNIGTNVGQVITVSYTPVGGFQNQNSFNISQFGIQAYSSGTSPVSGIHFAESADCQPPPAPQSDCLGAVTLCSQDLQVNQAPQNTGGVVDLNASNRGCLVANERQGLWYTWTVQEAGNLAFTIYPQPWPIASGTPFTIFDWAVWGPYAGLTCPPPTQPYRCNWASVFQPKGMQFNNSLPTSVGGAGPPMIRHMTVQAGEVYILYVDNWGMTGLNFSIEWQTSADPAFQPMASIDCIVLPVDHMLVEAIARPRHVDVDWATLSEQYAVHYDVERSTDGEHFATIGRVNALGMSQSMTRYGFRDDDPILGKAYYRIKQMDQLGSHQYSDVVEVFYRPQAPQLEVFPNPADELIQVGFERLEEGSVDWRITDASGRVVLTGREAGDRGPNRMEVPLFRLEAGSYVIDLRDAKGNSLGNARFVKH